MIGEDPFINSSESLKSFLQGAIQRYTTQQGMIMMQGNRSGSDSTYTGACCVIRRRLRPQFCQSGSRKHTRYFLLEAWQE